MVLVRILIDGHNLIPYVPGLSLEDPDDEEALIRLLGEYARRGRHILEVFFDKAPAGQSGTRVYGAVSANFVPARSIADHAIRERLKALRGEARQVLVVSSDRQVQAEARAQGAATRTSAHFAGDLVSSGEKEKAPRRPAEKPRKTVEPKLPPDEVQEWLDLFKKNQG
jgi:hypothetical protein